MVISTNQSALQGARLLSAASARLSKSIARLSSGSRITSPEDDAAGLAQATKLSSESRRHRAAMINLQNAISLSQTQDGYLQKVQKALDRMGEMAVLALDGTKTDEDRGNYGREFQQLKGFIDQSFEAKFDGVGLFSTGPAIVTSLTNQNGIGQVSQIIDTGGVSGTVDLTWDFFAAADRITVYYPPQGSGGTQLFDSGTVLNNGSASIQFGPGIDTNIEIILNEGGGGTTWQYDVTITAEAGSPRQVTTDGQGSTFSLPTVRPVAVAGDIDTAAEAASTLEELMADIQSLAERRAQVGATLTRLRAHYEELSIVTENLDAATSRIVDADVAQEMMQYTRNQILVQSGTAMLAQANFLPETALRLL